MDDAGSIWIQLGLLLAPVMALLALPLAVAIALALIRLFRWRVARSMGVAAGLPREPEPPAGNGGKGALAIEVIEAARTEARGAPLLVEARRRRRELAAIHAEAACVYPLAFTFLWWPGIPPNLAGMAALFGIFFLVFATPVVFAGMMVFTKQPGLLALAAGALAAVLFAFDRATAAEAGVVLFVGAAAPFAVALMLALLRRRPRVVILAPAVAAGVLLAAAFFGDRVGGSGSDFAGLWAMVAGVPAAAVVLLTVRRLRAVGPVVFVATLLALYGTAVGASYAGLYVAQATGLRFVRQDLAALPFLDAALGLPATEMLALLGAARRDFASVFAYDAGAVTPWVELVLRGSIAVAAGLGALAAWGMIRWLADSYRRRRASDQMLTIEVMMLIFVAPLAVLVTTVAESPLRGWLLGAVGLASFAGYKVWTRRRLRAWRQKKPSASPRALLLLRVFGFDRRTQRLLEDVGERWRYLGPIRLIAGPDLASATLEPHEFFDFLNGRLSRAFVTDRDDLEGRRGHAPAAPDPDGRYRVEEFFCHDDTWRMTVSRLARDSDAILMDLRGFTPANQGCVFEIEQLVAGVELDRVVFLADASTDADFLEATLRRAWRSMPGDSPNAACGRHRARILKAAPRHRRTRQAALALLCHDFGKEDAAAFCPSARQEAVSA